MGLSILILDWYFYNGIRYTFYWYYTFISKQHSDLTLRIWDVLLIIYGLLMVYQMAELRTNLLQATRHDKAYDNM